MLKHLLYTLFAAVLGFLVGYALRSPRTIIEQQTRIDTVFYTKPEPLRVDVEHRSVTVPCLLFAPADTVVQTVVVAENSDSVTLSVPVERREYCDSTYRAVVSGAVVGDIHPSLDFIETYNRTTVQTVPMSERRKYFAVTAGVGAAYTPKGLQPFVGVSVGVVLWRF